MPQAESQAVPQVSSTGPAASILRTVALVFTFILVKYTWHEVCSVVWHNAKMCGRYRLSRQKQIIEEHFDCGPWDDDWSPRYNIAPTQHVPVVRQNPTKPVREIARMNWGLIPNWAKSPSGAAGMINAPGESASTKPAFRDPLRLRRCLIPADGFYEWKRTGRASSLPVNPQQCNNWFAGNQERVQ